MSKGNEIVSFAQQNAMPIISINEIATYLGEKG
jgi:3,4-dihydroxy-2-butanone 4-phosphate synthase